MLIDFYFQNFVNILRERFEFRESFWMQVDGQWRFLVVFKDLHENGRCQVLQFDELSLRYYIVASESTAMSRDAGVWRECFRRAVHLVFAQTENFLYSRQCGRLFLGWSEVNDDEDSRRQNNSCKNLLVPKLRRSRLELSENYKFYYGSCKIPN